MVKASFFCEIAMVTRGFETRLQILSSKEVHMVRRDGLNHVRDSIWRRHQPILDKRLLCEVHAQPHGLAGVPFFLELAAPEQSLAGGHLHRNGTDCAHTIHP